MEHVERTVLTVEEAAARLGVSLSTLWRRVKDGKLPTKRMLGRVVIEPADVDRLRDSERSS